MVPMRLGLAVLTLCLAGGCATSPAPSGGPGPPAAEPETAPTTGAPPAGRVLQLGTKPEGLAVDAQTHVVAVAIHDPAALVLLDGGSGAELRRVGLPGTARHLQNRPGMILVPVETANELLQVAVPDGHIASRATTGRGPHDAAATASGRIFVANEFDRSVAIIRESTVEHTFGGVEQPGGVATFGETVGVVDVGRSTLTIFDAERTAELAKVSAGNGPTHVVADRRGRFIVIDTRGNALLLYETTPEVRQVRTVPLDGGPYGVAYDQTRDRLWVSLTGRNELVGFDLTTEPPTPFARWPTVRQPNTVAVDASTGRVFITGTADGVLQYLDP